MNDYTNPYIVILISVIVFSIMFLIVGWDIYLEPRYKKYIETRKLGKRINKNIIKTIIESSFYYDWDYNEKMKYFYNIHWPCIYILSIKIVSFNGKHIKVDHETSLIIKSFFERYESKLLTKNY